MKIHLTGSNWHAGTTQNLKKAFETLGHEVFFFEKHLSRNSRIARNLVMRFARRPYVAENYFYEITSRHWLESVKAFSPDLIVIEDAPTVLAEYIKQARVLGRPIFYYEISPPQESGARDVLLSFKYADEAFCIDREWAKFIEIFSPKKVHHLPLAGSPEDFYPLPKEKKIYDVAFVASAPEQSPDGLIRANLANSIPKNLRVGVFGSGWHYWTRYFPELAGRIGGARQPSIAEVNRIYNQSKIMINFHSTSHRTSISSRTFEIALSSGFQIADYREDFSLLFPKDFFPIYEDVKSMNELIVSWLPREAERNKRAAEAREYVLAHHTWLHRAKEMLKVFADYAKKRA